MPRRHAFTFATFDIQLQPSLPRAFPMTCDAPDRSFELRLSERLDAIRRLFDNDASHGRAAASA